MNEVTINVVLFLYLLSLSIILLYSSNGFVMLYYLKKYGAKKHSKNDLLKLDKKVTIQLPIYNEKYVVERIVNSVCELDYTKENLEIQILDDSTDDTFEILNKLVHKKREEGFNIVLLHRDNRKGFKAGALSNGLKTATGEFIAIFDADFIPRKNFLKETLSYFTSDKIGMVQSRWEHLNKDYSLITKVQAYALNAHFVIEQHIRNNAGFFINFNGTGGVIRKKCIDDSGGWQADTITEDLDLSYRAQLKGWKFIYLKDFTTPAELPIGMNPLKAQQFRWTKGAIETARKLLLKVWKSKINFKIKIQSTYHLTNNFVFPFILLVAILNIPIVYIKHTGEYDELFNWMSVFIIALISSFLLYYKAQNEDNQNWIKRILLFPLFLAGSMGLSVNNTKAVFEGMFNLKSEFVRTPKYLQVVTKDKKSWNEYLPKSTPVLMVIEFIFSLYSFWGVLLAIYYLNFTAFFFNLLFFIGFGIVSVLSLKESLFNKNTVRKNG